MIEVHPILHDIRAYLSETGLAPSYFGKLAAGNSELVSRLERGGALHFRTEARVRQYMAENPPSVAARSEGAG